MSGEYLVEDHLLTFLRYQTKFSLIWSKEKFQYTKENQICERNSLKSCNMSDFFL